MKSSRNSTLLVMKLNTAHSSTTSECVWMCAAKSAKDFPDVFTHNTKFPVHSIASLHLGITISSWKSAAKKQKTDGRAVNDHEEGSERSRISQERA
jgi:hypothetical protein